jgi:hypothetical protein
MPSHSVDHSALQLTGTPQSAIDGRGYEDDELTEDPVNAAARSRPHHWSATPKPALFFDCRFGHALARELAWPVGGLLAIGDRASLHLGSASLDRCDNHVRSESNGRRFMFS